MFVPVSVLSYHHSDGKIEPIRFNINGKVYRCGQLISVAENKFAGNPMRVFKFQKGKREYELHYEINSCKWFIKDL